MAKAKSVLGIPIEQDMINVVNMVPGQSAPFLFYTVHFIDLQNPVGFDKDAIAAILQDSKDICKRGGSGLPLSYLTEALKRSRYFLVAINNNEHNSVGSIVMAAPDATDSEGIYVEASCNTAYANVKRVNPLFKQKKDEVASEVGLLTDDELVEEYNKKRTPVQQIKSILPKDRSLYKSMLVTRRLKALNIEPNYDIKISIRTAQLLKLTLFNYANRALNIKHAYNAAAGVDAAMLHASNGMVLRTTKCGQPDQQADQFRALSTKQQRQLIESGKLKKDSSGSYPMKLCNYNFNVLFADLLEHTVKTLIGLEKEGITMDEILSVDIQLIY